MRYRTRRLLFMVSLVTSFTALDWNNKLLVIVPSMILLIIDYGDWEYNKYMKVGNK